MLVKRSAQRSGRPCWLIFICFAVGVALLAHLAAPVSAEEISEAPSPDVTDDGEALTTPSTPLRRFVWRVRNWMFHRDDADTNVEVDPTDSTDASVERSTEQECDGTMCKPRSWARALAQWFARGIRHVLEQLYPPEEGGEPVSYPDGTAGAPNGVIPNNGSKDNGEDPVIEPNRHIFRPWTALPPPPPPGMTTSPRAPTSDAGLPEPGASSTSGASSTFGTSSTSRGRSTPRVNSTPDASSTPAASSSSAETSGTSRGTSPETTVPITSTVTKMKKPRRRRPTTTTTSTAPPSPPEYSAESSPEQTPQSQLPSLSTETFVQDTGNEI